MMDTDRNPLLFSSANTGALMLNVDDIVIDTLTPEVEESAVALIRRNLAPYEEAGTVLASTFRRLESLQQSYAAEGTKYIVARVGGDDQTCIGGAGIGPLHGLPASEGLGEVRDMVVDKQFRGRGIGKRLLKRCVDEAREMGYKRLYLETTPQMENAQKLFVRFGFRPVTHAQEQKISPGMALPCYYILENLEADA